MPQLNPEFYISQLFWLVLTFTFLFVFLWRISLPRISNVLEKRANKINNDVIKAKEYQTEAEDIQIKIDSQLKEAKLENNDFIKDANFNFQKNISRKLEAIDKSLNTKIENATNIIEKNKKESLKLINNQIIEITKLTLSKISNIKVDDESIKESVNIIQKKNN